MATSIPATKQQKTELFAFLAITLVATFALEIIAIARLGSGVFASPIPTSAMFIPATAVIICLFRFRSAALTRQAKAFYAFFFVSAAAAITEMGYRPLLGTIGGYPILSTSVATAGFLTLVAFNLKKEWRARLAPAGLSVGRNGRYYLLLLLFSALYIIGQIISYSLGWSAPAVEFSLGGFFSAMGIAVASLVFSWSVYFGEEYGWRYYMQDRMFALIGGYRGVVLLGTIWALWHLPMMLMGLNFPSDPAIPANLTYIVYAIALSVVFGYAVLKTGSVLIAIILHGLTDIIVNASRGYIGGTPTILSFAPLLVIMVIFALVLLRSRVWMNVG